MSDVRVPTHEQIEQRAYELYLKRGCDPEKELEDWLGAETGLLLEIEVQNQSARAAKMTKVKGIGMIP